METSKISGVTSAVRKMDGRSTPLTPPGTAPAVVWVVAAAVTTTPEPEPEPVSADASGMSSGASVGPPGVATMATDRSASAWLSRFVG